MTIIKCPFCAEEIKDEATKCKHCKSDLAINAKSDTASKEVKINIASPKKQSKAKSIAIGCLIIFAVIIILSAIISTLSSFSNSSGEFDYKVISCAIQGVKEVIKAPSTAKFRDYSKTSFPISLLPEKIKDGEYVVSNYVDAENSYGAMIRSNFTCTVWMGNSDSKCFSSCEILD